MGVKILHNIALTKGMRNVRSYKVSLEEHEWKILHGKPWCSQQTDGKEVLSNRDIMNNEIGAVKLVHVTEKYRRK